MNCKPGDLAVIVKVGPLTQSALGKIVTVLQLSEYYNDALGPAWDYEPPMQCSGYKLIAIEDCCLRPIRPNDGEDEMLRIAGKPRETDVPNPQAA